MYKKIMPLLMLLILTGCGSTTPVSQVQIDEPVSLMLPPKPYKAIQEGTSLKDSLPIIADNNTAAVDNARHLEQLQEWVRELISTIKNGN